MKPVFLFSLPRSGSTLLQKVLSAHPGLFSAAEPWILLPLAAITESARLRTHSAFSSRSASRAVNELIAELPHGSETYQKSVREFVEGLYQSMCVEGESYFLDKTPRYYLILDFIFEVFPDARFIFLFRNPLDVLASTITTWGGGRLWLHHFHVDLFEGPRCLHEGWTRYGDRSLSVHYRDLVTDPTKATRGICDFLQLDFQPQMLSEYRAVEFSGAMGDQHGIRTYPSISSASLGSWKTVLNTPVRRWYARRLLRSAGPEVLTTFGESLVDLEQQISRAPMRWSLGLSDMGCLAASALARHSAAKVVIGQWQGDHRQVCKLD